MTLTAPDEATVAALGAGLLGRPVRVVRPSRQGGNNRIYRLESDDGSLFVLKFYPPQSADPRDRLAQEFDALSFLAGHGVTTVPRPLAADRDHHCAVYEWVEGELPGAPTAADIDAFARFLEDIQALREASGVEVLRPASASCFAPAAAVAQLQQRLTRLYEAAGSDAELAEFLDRHLVPGAAAFTARARAVCDEAGIEFAADLAPERRVLSPSDFGLHNTLRRPDGALVFLDFEYFGWDDPVKVLADAMLHPGSALPPHLGERLYRRLYPVFAGQDKDFLVRFRLLYPVYALIWCLIMLNEFLPERWSRRKLAADPPLGDEVRRRQLAKARQLYHWIDGNHDVFDDPR